MPSDREDPYRILPIRFGKATGASNERRMLDNVGGQDGIRTKTSPNADGSVTTLRTKAGNPKFTTVAVPVVGCLKGPLVEQPGGRVYYDAERVWSYDGIWSMPLRPVKYLVVKCGNTGRVTVATTDGDPSHVTGVPVIKSQFGERGRVYTAETVGVVALYNRPAADLGLIEDMVIPMLYESDKRLDQIQFSLRGFTTTLNLTDLTGYPLVNATGLFGTFALCSVLPNFGYPTKGMQFEVEADPSTPGFSIAFAGEGKWLERQDIEVLKFRMLGEYTIFGVPPLAIRHHELNWSALGKGYACPLGVYTDHTLASRIDDPDPASSLTYDSWIPGPSVPRYFKLTANADRGIAGQLWTQKGDVCFHDSRPAPACSRMLLPGQHIYKDPMGDVWLIEFESNVNPHTWAEVMLINGLEGWFDHVSASVRGVNQNWVRVKLVRRFDRIFEENTLAPRVLGEITVPNYYRFSRNHGAGVTPTASPFQLGTAYFDTATPPAYSGESPSHVEAVSAPDGNSALVFLSHNAPGRFDFIVSPAGAPYSLSIPAAYQFFDDILSSLVSVQFSGVGGADGSGVVATLTEIPLFSLSSFTGNVLTGTSPYNSDHTIIVAAHYTAASTFVYERLHVVQTWSTDDRTLTVTHELVVGGTPSTVSSITAEYHNPTLTLNGGALPGGGSNLRIKLKHPSRGPSGMSYLYCDTYNVSDVLVGTYVAANGLCAGKVVSTSLDHEGFSYNPRTDTVHHNVDPTHRGTFF